MTLDELYELAETNGHDVDWIMLTHMDGFTMRLSNGRYAIVIDPTKISTSAEHKTKLGHGLGHAETGAIYNPYTPLDVVQRHENRADKWNILHQIPEAELKDAISRGYKEPWELAEIFEVTEELVKKAMVWYRYGTMDYLSFFPAVS